MGLGNRGCRARSRAGISLIEILVVIAIMVLLLAIILPHLSGSRRAARQAVSLHNLGHLGRAVTLYVGDFKGRLPLPASRRLQNIGGEVLFNWPRVSGDVRGYAPWMPLGKNCDSHWFGDGTGFDLPAIYRPLNQYLINQKLPSPTSINGFPVGAADRVNFQLPVCKDPTDNVSFSRSWPPSADTLISTYDDVGTSYLANTTWHDQVMLSTGRRFGDAWFYGYNRLCLGEIYQQSKLVFMMDSWANATMISPEDNARITNGFGEVNKGNMLFLDAHAAYLPVIPGSPATYDPLNPPKQYFNDNYHVAFP